MTSIEYFSFPVKVSIICRWMWKEQGICMCLSVQGYVPIYLFNQTTVISRHFRSSGKHFNVLTTVGHRKLVFVAWIRHKCIHNIINLQILNHNFIFPLQGNSISKKPLPDMQTFSLHYLTHSKHNWNIETKRHPDYTHWNWNINFLWMKLVQIPFSKWTWRERETFSIYWMDWMAERRASAVFIHGTRWQF